jgi:hypothetical protein
MAAEAEWLIGKNHTKRKKRKTGLTLTGLLMERVGLALSVRLGELTGVRAH